MKIRNYFIVVLFMVSVPTFGQQGEKEAVKNTIETFFDAFHTQDSVQIKRTVSKALRLQSVLVDSLGKTTLRTEGLQDFLGNIVSIPKTVSFKEELKSYHIQVDGAMAHVWTPYDFWLNGKFHHCGVNSFQLFRSEGIWRIIYLMDTRRTDCH